MFMKIDTLKINEIIYFIFSFIFFVIISTYIVLYFDINRHWTHNLDQEFTLTYNALLFNNGITQEYLDHTGYFTILFLSIFIKLSQIFQFIDIYNLRSALENENIDSSFQNIILITRIYSGFSVAIWCISVNLIFYYISKSKLFSFFLTLIIFSFPGTIFHISQLRTELFASFFMILSLVMMINFLDAKNDNNYIKKISLFFIFIFCAILNKSQVFLFIFGLILLSLYFYNSLKKIDFKFIDTNFLERLNYKKQLIILYFIISIYVLFKLSIYNGNYNSFFFLILNLGILNLIFYYLAKKSNLDPIKFIFNINIILVISFLILKMILFMHPSTTEKAFISTIINIMGITVYSEVNSLGDEQGIIKLINFTFLKLKEVFLYYFKDINIFSILIVTILMVSIIFKRKIGNKLFFFNLTCILVPIAFTFISSFRAINIYYHIFWDFIFLLPFCIFFKKLKFNINFILTISILTLILFLNFKNLSITNIYGYSKENFCEDLEKNEDSYLLDWHKKIPKEKFIFFCNYQ